MRRLTEVLMKRLLNGGVHPSNTTLLAYVTEVVHRPFTTLPPSNAHLSLLSTSRTSSSNPRGPRSSSITRDIIPAETTER